MNVRALNLFTKIALHGKGKAYFTKKYQSFTQLEDEYVVINPLSAADEDDTFIQHIKNSHGFKNVNKYACPIWTTLHEIGHLRTNDDVEDDPDTRNFCQYAYDNGILDYDQINSLYYDMPDEWAATEWAIEFVKSHKILCKIFTYLI